MLFAEQREYKFLFSICFDGDINNIHVVCVRWQWKLIWKFDMKNWYENCQENWYDKLMLSIPPKEIKLTLYKTKTELNKWSELVQCLQIGQILVKKIGQKLAKILVKILCENIGKKYLLEY